MAFPKQTRQAYRQRQRGATGEQLPDLEIRIWPEAGNLTDIEYFAFMHPDFDSLRVFPNLNAMSSCCAT